MKKYDLDNLNDVAVHYRDKGIVRAKLLDVISLGEKIWYVLINNDGKTIFEIYIKDGIEIEILN